jgi:hypothetical protein
MVLVMGEQIGVVSAKTKTAGKDYKVVKLLVRIAGHTSIMTVNDYENRDWGGQGEIIRMLVWNKPYVNQKSGIVGDQWFACKDQSDVAQIVGSNGAGNGGKKGSPYQ